VKRLNSSTSQRLVATLKVPIDAAAAGKASEAETSKAFDEALTTMMADAREWIERLQKQSADATDPGLSTAIAEVAKELAPLRTGKASMQKMNKIVQKSEADLVPYCGGTPVVEASTQAPGPTGVGPGKACPAPIAFDTAEKWKPVPITDQFIDGIRLTDEGLTLLCEIDAKPAEVIGFIRVWKVQAANLHDALRDGVRGFTKGQGFTFKKITVGGRDALEATYTSDGSPGRAFVVTASNGDLIVVNWTGFDKEEHQAGLPAYELARSSLTYP
jgi:hypothetical protein